MLMRIFPSPMILGLAIAALVFCSIGAMPGSTQPGTTQPRLESVGRFGEAGDDPIPCQENQQPVIVSIALTNPQNLNIGDVLTNSDFTIVTSPSGYQNEVTLSFSPSPAVAIGLNTVT